MSEFRNALLTAVQRFRLCVEGYEIPLAIRELSPTLYRFECCDPGGQRHAANGRVYEGRTQRGAAVSFGLGNPPNEVVPWLLKKRYDYNAIHAADDLELQIITN